MGKYINVEFRLQIIVSLSVTALMYRCVCARAHVCVMGFFILFYFIRVLFVFNLFVFFVWRFALNCATEPFGTTMNNKEL